MKIALIGYGKMGKAIEEIACSKGHEIVLAIGIDNLHEFTKEAIQKADVCIEFSAPESAFDNVRKCLTSGVPTVCGSTGWLNRLPDALEICKDHDTAFLYASNFSIGVNLFFKINRHVAEIMKSYPDYNVSMEEIHHTQKKDAPSGTAVTLAEDILDFHQGKTKWVNQPSTEKEDLVILSQRIDPAPGTHSINYDSDIDTITLTHTAHSRKGFAAGALMAAEYIFQRKGIYTMDDVISSVSL
jgi:4-hydroxy-tetrahydrodipicolinate reductase